VTTIKPIPIVDLQGQYHRLKSEIDPAIQEVLTDGNFINGKQVSLFADELSKYTGSLFTIPCANGTDALQLAYMALDLQPGDEIIIPAFNYVAAAEAARLLGLNVVFSDVDSVSFNIDPSAIESKITTATKAVVAVHLFGQGCDMEAITSICEKHNLFLIEDNAQAIGAEITQGKFAGMKLGTIGRIGTTSFFPSKNLGCMGDGGALFCQDEELASRIKMIANHGQKVKYKYEFVGINSRLDTIQAAILRVKLNHLDEFTTARQNAAAAYTRILKERVGITTPAISQFSTHVFHQYTIRFENLETRNQVKARLQENDIQSMIYYPSSLHLQKAYAGTHLPAGSFPVSESLCERVLSLPMHSEMTNELVEFICSKIDISPT
jgi:UDP-2-acetamido-2-deoxy-ribo-hexuluronate aminotransferase